MKVLRAERVASAARAADFPRPDLPEVAFLGRSNVGKSSLLNRLVKRKGLAQTSNTPGKTRLLHFYRVEGGADSLLFVDLPGYGWARVSKAERRRWQALVETYLEDRPALRAAVLLQDVRRDPGEDEDLLIAWLAERGIPTLVAITKVDKLKPMRRAARVRLLVQHFPLPKDCVIATSSEKGLGLGELWAAIDACVRDG